MIVYKQKIRKIYKKIKKKQKLVNLNSLFKLKQRKIIKTRIKNFLINNSIKIIILELILIMLRKSNNKQTI